jgi:bacteriorhodopsin
MSDTLGLTSGLQTSGPSRTDTIVCWVCACCFLMAAGLNLKDGILNRIHEVKGDRNFRNRAIYCSQLQLLMCVISAFGNIVMISEVDDVYVPYRGIKVDVAKYCDWVVTCPMLQLILIVLAGPDCKVYVERHLASTALVILFGASATFVSAPALRGGLFFCGCCVFMSVVYNMDRMIVEASKTGSSITKGSHELRMIVLVTVITWLLFPLTWACSTDGFALLPQAVTAFPIINVVSKVGFVMAFRMCMGRLVTAITADEKGGLSRRVSLTDILRSRNIVVADVEVQCDLDGDGVPKKAFTGRCTDDLTAIVRTAAQEAELPAEEVDRVLKALLREWVYTTSSFIALTFEDLRTMGIPLGLAHAAREAAKKSGAYKDEEAGFSFDIKDSPVTQEMKRANPQPPTESTVSGARQMSCYDSATSICRSDVHVDVRDHGRDAENYILTESYSLHAPYHKNTRLG